MSAKSSIIWKLSRHEFNSVVQASSTYKEVLIKLGFAIKSGGNYKTLKQRIKDDKIDVSHIENNKKLFRGSSKKIPLEDVLIKNSSYSTKSLKSRLLKAGLLENRCLKCGNNDMWQGKPITLQLDHINGDHDDNRLENLRILCPNCHSQTKNYAGRNSQRNNDAWICKCGNRKHKQARVCVLCFKQPEKIKWPSDNELVRRSQEQSLVNLSKELKISDSAIRKRLKKIGADSRA